LIPLTKIQEVAVWRCAPADVVGTPFLGYFGRALINKVPVELDHHNQEAHKSPTNTNNTTTIFVVGLLLRTFRRSHKRRASEPISL